MRDMQSARNIYLVQTPYHLLLSILLADPRESSIFVFVSADEERWLQYLPALREMYGPGCYRTVPQWSRRSLARLSVGWIGAGTLAYRNIAREFRDSRPQVFVFNDSDVETQMLMSWLRPRRIIHLEDGSFSYVNFRLARSRFAELWKTVISFGRYESRDVIGATRGIRWRMALFPDRVRAQLQPSAKLEITTDGLTRLKRLAGLLIVGFPQGRLAIFTVPLERLDREEMDWYVAMMKRFKRSGFKICLKAHPRQIGDLKGFCSVDFVLSPFVPLELFALHSEQVKAVVGVANTSSIVLRALSSSVSVVALLKGPWAGDSYAVETLRLSGVEVHSVSVTSEVDHSAV